jgi:hypothetical protein
VFAVFAPQKYFTIRGFVGIEDSDPLDERESKRIEKNWWFSSWIEPNINNKNVFTRLQLQSI